MMMMIKNGRRQKSISFVTFINFINFDLILHLLVCRNCAYVLLEKPFREIFCRMFGCLSLSCVY